MDRVKRWKNGFITDPKTLSPTHTLADVEAIKKRYGFSGVPITDTGRMGGKLLGIVTNRDTDFVADLHTPLSQVMSTDMVVARDSVTLQEANQIMKQSKKAKLPIVNEKFELCGLISRSDLLKNREVRRGVRKHGTLFDPSLVPLLTPLFSVLCFQVSACIHGQKQAAARRSRHWHSR